MSGNDVDGRSVSRPRVPLTRWKPRWSEVAAWVRKAARPVAATVLVVAAMGATARTPVALLVVGMLAVVRHRARRRRSRARVERGE
jgi:hypothetical protein